MGTLDRDEATDVRVNGETRAVRARVLSELLRELGHDPERRGIAVSVNEEVVPRGRWRSFRVGNGDRVEIVGAAQGG